MSAWKVGDPVVVLPDGNNMGGCRAVVAKVGRVWMTIGGGYRTRMFSLADGHEKGDGVGGYCVAVTPEEASRRAALAVADARVRVHGSPWDWRGLTVEETNAIADILDAAKARGSR